MKYMNYDPKLTERRRALRRSATQAELMLWDHLRCRKLQGLRFRRQFSIGPYILDLYCPKLRLAIEIDGQQHFTSDGIEYDEQRSHFLEENNVRVIRFKNDDVIERAGNVLEEISKHIPLAPFFEGESGSTGK